MTSQKVLINNFKKICICRSIKGGTILAAMEEGTLSFEALRRRIRVGTGNCKAKRCRSKIEEMVQEYKKEHPAPAQTPASHCP